MTYKKLDKNGLKDLYNSLAAIFKNNEKYSPVIVLVKQYFKNPHSILINIDSEYNDETYDNRLTGIFVYDKDGIECGLTLKNREKFIIECDNLDLGESESDDPMEDVVLYVDSTLPEVYVKE